MEQEEEVWCCWEYYKGLRHSSREVPSHYICSGCGKSWLWTFDSSGHRGWEEMV